MARGLTVVVGAGLSGLACAHRLVQAGRRVIVLEARERAGGVVGTVERDGFQFETGPNTIPASARAFLEVTHELGLDERLLTSRRGARRWLFLGGRLVALPAGPLGLITTPLLSWRGKLQVTTEPLRRWTGPAEGEPEPDLEAFATERLGREAARTLIGAFVRGVYAAEIDELGVESAFPRLWHLVTEHKGLVRGAIARSLRRDPPVPWPQPPRGSLLSFPRGLRELVDALEQHVAPGMRTSAPVQSIERIGAGYLVQPGRGAPLYADAVVVAVPARHAAAILAPTIRPEHAQLLRSISHAQVTVVSLGLGGADAAAVPDGFGFLVPPDEARRGTETPKALGVVFVSNLFPGRAPQGMSSVSAFYRSADVAGREDVELARIAAHDLALAFHLQRDPEPRVVYVQRWEDVIPRYSPGHAERMTGLRVALASELPGLVLAGNFMRGVSVDSVLACGRGAARALIEQE